MTNMSLLEYLSREVNCVYLSDLRYDPLCRRAIPCVLRRLEPRSFALSEWQEAVCYLLSQPAEGKTAEQLYQMLTEDPP